MQPKPFKPKQTFFVASILIGLTVWTYYFRDIPGPPNYHWQGRTMGTTWNIKVADADLSQQDAEALLAEIESILEAVNQAMSTYRPESEISAFNQAPANQPQAISESFAEVLKTALQLSRDSNRAFDPTVGPLMDLWGFGPEGDSPMPTDDTIREVMTRMGPDQIQFDEKTRVSKLHENVELDLNAIAKGYAVDLCSDALSRAGLSNAMVEIGGEVRVHGHGMKGKPWKLGIQVPIQSADAPPQLFGVTQLTDVSMATSGDYRNYRIGPDGEMVTHILDPRSGRPATHHLASVTVIAPTCMEADGLATAAFVMGPEEGLSFLERRPDVDALLLVRISESEFEQQMTSGFAARTKYVQTDK